MAVQTATVGKIVIEGGTITNVVDGTLDVTIGEGDITAIGDSWTNAVPLAKSWTCTFRVNHDKGGTAVSAVRTEWVSGDQELTTVQFWVDGSSYFSAAAAMLAGYSLTKSVGAVDQVSITLRSKGALTYTV
uniref:Uncharacterized protein n=1 Tax=viral metagenome TaxID=1070528 RepID=A0A6M3KAJ0_9ZZZZ